MATIDHPASPGDVTRAALWCVYLIGELLVLGSLWSAGSQGYDVEGRSTQVDAWIGSLHRTLVLLIVGLSAPALWLILQTLRRRCRSTGALLGLLVGLLAVTGGLLMIPRGAASCYRSCAPSPLGCRGTEECGQIAQWFNRYIEEYHRAPRIVIAAGATLMLVSSLCLLATRRTPDLADPRVVHGASPRSRHPERRHEA